MLKGPVDGQMTDLTYDARNRLVKAGKVSYTYDCENTRIATEEDGITTGYVTETGGSLSRMLIAYENVGTDKASETHYYYGAEGLSCQNNDSTGQYFAYHYDYIGSTTLITDKVGRIIEKFAYGTYGELLTEVVNNIRFLYNGSFGVVTDSNGLYYMRACYYNPDIKRFINQDIKVGDISNGQGLNRYAYCEGNPVSMVDPFGLCGENANEQGETSKYQWLHNALDIAGLVFDGADVINAGVYALEGKWGQAAVSLACALPAIGTAIAGVSKATKFAKVGNIIGQTMKYAGKAYMTVQTATQALEMAGDAKVQYAVNGGKVTPDMALNIAGAAAMGALAVMSAGSMMKEVTSLAKASGIKMETTVRDVADSISGKVEKGSGISGGSGSSGSGMMKNKNRGYVVWPFGKGGRNSAGVVTGGENLTNAKRMMHGSQGNVGVIPKEIADKMRGRQYSNFDAFREDFWKTVADSSYASEFSNSNIGRMRNGRAPKVVLDQTYGQLESYILHHKTPIHAGGEVYNLDNLAIVTPRMHQEILDKAYHFGN